MLTLDSAFTQASSLEIAQKSSDQYNAASILHATSEDDKPSDLKSIVHKRTCFFRGGTRHNRRFGPAKGAICYNCEKESHFLKVC